MQFRDGRSDGLSVMDLASQRVLKKIIKGGKKYSGKRGVGDGIAVLEGVKDEGG